MLGELDKYNPVSRVRLRSVTAAAATGGMDVRVRGEEGERVTLYAIDPADVVRVRTAVVPGEHGVVTAAPCVPLTAGKAFRWTFGGTALPNVRWGGKLDFCLKAKAMRHGAAVYVAHTPAARPAPARVCSNCPNVSKSPCQVRYGLRRRSWHKLHTRCPARVRGARVGGVLGDKYVHQVDVRGRRNVRGR